MRGEFTGTNRGMTPDGDSLTFIGTATVLLRLGPFTVLTDPKFLHKGQWTYIGQGPFSKRRTASRWH